MQYERLGKLFEDEDHLERAYDYVSRNIAGMPDERNWREAIYSTRTVKEMKALPEVPSIKQRGVSPLHGLFTEIKSRGTFEVKGVRFVVEKVGEERFHKAYEEWCETGKESLGWEIFRKTLPTASAGRNLPLENS